ncbi:MAG: S8 family serine peptidase [Lachnospiraceae bacterium]|nr:S8 family serine peptidase [Lachnospiraceae bacterium]
MRKTVIALAMCVTLAFSSLSTVCAASQLSVTASTTDEQKLYVEGEALAIVRGKEQLQGPGRTERIAQVSAGAIEDAIGEWNSSGSGVAVTNTALAKESGRQFEENETFTIWSVSDHNQTTEEILRELRTNPDVIVAEPNYIAYAANEEAEAEPEEAVEAEESEAEEPEPEAEANNSEEENPAEDSESDNTEHTAAKGDLSSMQWSNGIQGPESAEIYTTPLSPTAGYTMEVPGWQEGRTNPNAPANAGGTICIMDTGVDTDHPDLQGVLYEFTPEQQAKYGCGKYGYNASGDGRPENEQKATDSHGTHVAGIIAANWNGEGTSGIANGVKIFSVNVFGGNGTEQDIKSNVKGFQFLLDVAQEVNLKAVNCSWGTAQPIFILSVMMDELGRKGVNTVIASGNRYCDLDDSIDLGSMTNSEYVIVVNAASMDGKMTDFSCWGQSTTDVFAPGGGIFSSVTQIIREDLMGETYSYQDNTRFIPEVTPEDHLLSGIERFDEEEPGVRFFDQNPALSEDAREIGEINTANGFDDKRAAAIRLSDLKKEAKREHAGFSAINGYVYMAIPVPSGENVEWIGVKTAMSDGFKPNGGIDSITCKGADGEPVEIDCLCSGALKRGCETGAFSNIYQCQWAQLSYNVKGFIEASNELHEMLQKGMEEEKINDLGIVDYKDPGEITGIYEWEDQEQNYLIARIGIGHVAKDSRSYESTQDTTLYFDNAAAGDADAYTGSYMFMSGTSMAAPAVTGCLGVIAKDEPANASLSEEELMEAARGRAAKLLAAVDYDEALSGLCSTGGRVNLHGQTDFARKAPLISKAQVEDRGLELSGWYFGQEGTLAIDGVEIETQTWQDNIITADIRALPNGSHVAAVTNADGAVNRAVFSTSSQDAEGRMLFERSHSVPVLYPAFIADQSDRIYGPMAISGGKIYTMAETAKYKIAQAIWCYDIEEDSWARLPLPEDYDPHSNKDGAFASLRDRLYLYGSFRSADETGENEDKGCLWRYEPYGDFWERLEIPMPNNAKGICALGDELFVVGGSVYNMQLEGAPADDEGVYDTGFYKADLARGALVRVGGKLPDDAAMDSLKITAGKNRMYIYAEIDDSFYEQPGETSENGIVYRKTVSGGRLFRIAYDGAENKITFEELTDTLNETLGDDLRTDYEYKMGGDVPGEHFAIAGLDTGVAIIGSATAGEDVHIIYDTDEKAVLYDKATCYHKAFDPIAVSDGKRLYVIGCNGTEPDVMYFRSQEMTLPAAASGGGEPGGANGGGNSGGMDPTVIGGVTIGLFAAAVLLLTGMRKKRSE